jgi:hypothetical protein
LVSAGIDRIRIMARDIQEAQDPNMELLDSCNFILAMALRSIDADKAELLAATTPKTETSQEEAPQEETSQQRAAISEQQTPELFVDIDIDVFKQMLGFDERNLQPISMANTKADVNRNKDLENFYNTGDWMQSLEHHERMVIEASKGYRFNEAEQHVESMRTILTKVSAPRKLFDALENTERAIQAEHKLFLVSCTLNQPTSEDGGQAAEDTLKESESTHKSRIPRPTRSAIQDMAVYMKEFKDNPRKWWEWLEMDSGQGFGWIAQVYDNSITYREEGRLMNEVHGAYMAKDINATLSLMHKLDAICKDGIFADYGLRPSPLRRVINYFKTAPHQSEILHNWQTALASDDFKTAKALLGNLSDSVRLNGSPITHSNIEALYVATDREILLNFTLQFNAAAKDKQLSSCQKLYYGFIQLVDKAELSRIKPEVIMVIKSQALGMLMQQADENKQWNDGISYCNEFLMLYNGLQKSDLEARDACIQVKFSCEWGLVQEDLTEAETNLNFDKCLELVDAMVRLYETQEATPGRARSQFVLIGPKHVEFLKGSYRDRCLSCARWSRQRVSGDCLFPRGIGPNHNRSIFKVVFGCPHHCKGGYCWLM